MGSEPSREAVERLQVAATRYREAYDHVERLLQSGQGQSLPKWVFHVAGMNLDALRSLDPEVARAEQHRRAARAALYAVAELLALEDPGAPLGPATRRSSDDLVTALQTTGDSDAVASRKLDRFIGIVHAADNAGCLYVNGTFQPLEFHEDPESDEVTQIHAKPAV